MSGDPHELVSTPLDERRTGTGIPRHRGARERGDVVPKQGALWSFVPTSDAGGLSGTFPRGFLDRALALLGSPDPRRTLHVCSGSLARGTPGWRIDIRPDRAPDVVADGRMLPFRSGAFDAVLLDPPWSLEYARELYQTDYPRPSHLLREACRVVRPGGLFGIVHFIVPSPPRGARLTAVYGVTQGVGYRIRALTVYEREQQMLAPELADVDLTPAPAKRRRLR